MLLKVKQKRTRRLLGPQTLRKPETQFQEVFLGLQRKPSILVVQWSSGAGGVGGAGVAGWWLDVVWLCSQQEVVFKVQLTGAR